MGETQSSKSARRKQCDGSTERSPNVPALSQSEARTRTKKEETQTVMFGIPRVSTGGGCQIHMGKVEKA
jgi:hypothetical protein